MNPLITTVYCADPSVHKWENDERIWIYSSHDEPGTNTCDTMKSYHVFSSSDMVNWVDHGRVLDIENVKWAGKQMWAIDAAYRNGTYYLVFCAFEESTGIFRTGLATSDRPEGPFVDQGYIKGVRWGQDPALFIDDDGTPYLFVGAGYCIEGYELTDDLTEVVEGSYVDLTPQLPWAFEGPWVHKYKGKYYLSYPGLYENKWPEHMYYAIADNPLGPYTFKGQYIHNFKDNASTNHGSIVEYKGQWYAFHHSKWVSGKDTCRSIMCDYLYYDQEDQIIPIKPNEKGVSSTQNDDNYSSVKVVIDAATAPLSGGKMIGGSICTERSGYTGHGYAKEFKHIYNGINILIQSCKKRKARLIIRYAAPVQEESMKITINHVLIGSAEDVMAYDKRIIFPKCQEWQELDIGEILLEPGDNSIQLYNGEEGSYIEVDCFMVEEA